jgi:hypothetical protein
MDVYQLWLGKEASSPWPWGPSYVRGWAYPLPPKPHGGFLAATPHPIEIGLKPRRFHCRALLYSRPLHRSIPPVKVDLGHRPVARRLHLAPSALSAHHTAHPTAPRLAPAMDNCLVACSIAPRCWSRVGRQTSAMVALLPTTTKKCVPPCAQMANMIYWGLVIAQVLTFAAYAVVTAGAGFCLSPSVCLQLQLI